MAETTWTPYVEKIKEVIGGLPLAKLTDVAGRNIAAAAQGARCAAAIEAFSVDKIEKIVLGTFTGSSTQLGICTIIPAEGCDLPLFFSRWEEGTGTVGIFVDLMPTVDILVDEPYRKRFIEPLGELWEKFVNLPGITPEEDDDLRACCSIVYTAARIPVEQEGMRLAALAPTTAYLKKYIELYAVAAMAGDAAKQGELRRKTAAVRKTLREHCRRVLAGPAGQDIAASVSGQITEIFF